ncbi:hypothetical protein [Belliella pelovolcani]|uniref:hypothetical protein n=1 Tax=Belliella pelovolcani TaxID=529505 RepID=UPI003918BA92
MKKFKIIVILFCFGFFFSCSNDLETELPINEKSLSIEVGKILNSDNSNLVNLNTEFNPYLKDIRNASLYKDNIENYRMYSSEISYSVDDIINLGEDYKTLVFDIFKMGDNSDYKTVLLKSRNIEKLIMEKYPDSIEGDFLLKVLALEVYMQEKGVSVDFSNNRIMCGFECRWNLCMVTRLDAVADSNWYDQALFFANVVYNVIDMEISCLIDASDDTYHCDKGYICN